MIRERTVHRHISWPIIRASAELRRHYHRDQLPPHWDIVEQRAGWRRDTHQPPALVGHTYHNHAAPTDDSATTTQHRSVGSAVPRRWLPLKKMPRGEAISLRSDGWIRHLVVGGRRQIDGRPEGRGRAILHWQPDRMRSDEIRAWWVPSSSCLEKMCLSSSSSHADHLSDSTRL